MGQISIARGVVAIDPTSAPGVPLYTDVTSPQVLYSGTSGLISGSAKFQWINSTSSLEFGTGAEIYLYNTADQTTDYERGGLYWSANAFSIVTEKGGGGAVRTLNLGVNGASQWYISSSGHWLPISTNTYNLGASGSTVANFYVGTSLQGSSGATFELYNTADQTTNYERLRASFISNRAEVGTFFAGTGTPRQMRVGAGTISTLSSFLGFYSQQFPFVEAVLPNTASSGVLVELFKGTFTGSAGTQTIASIQPTINQSGTAGYTVLDVNPTESATGSGAKLLQRWAVGGTARAQIDNSGQFAGAAIYTTSSINWIAAIGSTPDLSIFRDAADILALRRSTNAQTFRVYNTYTDGSNYRRWNLSWNTTTAIMQVVGAGTGTNGNLAVGNAALATTATVGYFMIPSSAGAPTGVPADIPTGQVALHFDSTNNKLYVYDGGWLSTAALT